MAVPVGPPVGAEPQRKQELTAATQVAFKNYVPSKKCRTEINETFVDKADFINITMPMYNLTEYSDNYSDTSGNLWGFIRDKEANNGNVANNNSDDNNNDNNNIFFHLNTKQTLLIILRQIEKKKQ